MARETIRRIVRRLDVVPEITRIHDEDPILSSLLLSTESVDVEEEPTKGLSAFYLENDGPKTEYEHESALSPPAVFVRMRKH